MPAREVRIYCPKCQWKPVQSSRWMCNCGCTWNTFDTGGVCPQCGKAWQDTMCLSCRRWSRHRAWYHELFGECQRRKEHETAPIVEPLTR